MTKTDNSPAVTTRSTWTVRDLAVIPATRGWSGTLLSLIAVVAICAVMSMFAGEVVISALRSSPCCFDDASFAVVAKNWAQGHGYLLSLDYGNLDHHGALFPPQLGTGPSTIAVGAAVVWLFGAAPAAPALGLMAFNLALLIAWTGLVARRSGFLGALSYVAAFTVCAVTFTAQHHEHWFAFLGELQSFLLATFAFFLVGLGERRKVEFLLAGVLLGLSFLAKEMSALYVVAFGIVVLAQDFLRSRGQAESGHPNARILLVYAAAGTLAPIALFELYRLSALGAHGWLVNWGQHLQFIQSQGTGTEASLSQLLMERDGVLRERFYIGVPLLLAATIGVSGLVLRYAKSRQVRLLCSLLLAAFLIHFAYWLLKSNGWPRYALNSILFACALLPLPIIALKPTAARVVAPVVMILAIAAGWPGMRHYMDTYFVSAYRPAQGPSSTDVQRELATFLENGKERGVVYAPWWAHIAAPEYLGRRPGEFTAITAQSTAAGLLLIDKRVPVPEGGDYATLAARCHTVRTFGSQYEIQACQAAADTTPVSGNPDQLYSR